MAIRLVLCLAVVAAAMVKVDALTKEELASIENSVVEYVPECKGEYVITDDQIKEAIEKKSVEGINICAIGCILKKSKLINDQGLFEPERLKEIGLKHLGSEADQKKFNDIAEDCASVNKEDVTDGEMGCERAKKLFECFDKHKENLKE